MLETPLSPRLLRDASVRFLAGCRAARVDEGKVVQEGALDAPPGQQVRISDVALLQTE